jgi:hypothetical protein
LSSIIINIDNSLESDGSGFSDNVVVSNPSLTDFTSTVPAGSTVTGNGTALLPFMNSNQQSYDGRNSPGGNLKITMAGPLTTFTLKYISGSIQNGTAQPMLSSGLIQNRTAQRIHLSNMVFELGILSRVCAYNYSLPSNLTLNGVTSPQIDGYINQTGDSIGDTLGNWSGTEYKGFLQLNMHNAGNFNKELRGKAFLGYDCNSKMLCVAAHLLANDMCSVEEDDGESWVEFYDGSPTVKLQANSVGLSTNFKYVKYDGGTTGKTIGKFSCSIFM